MSIFLHVWSLGGAAYVGACPPKMLKSNATSTWFVALEYPSRGKVHDVGGGDGVRLAAHRSGDLCAHRIVGGTRRVGGQVRVAGRRRRVFVAKQSANDGEA